jgi:hypothetical protein
LGFSAEDSGVNWNPAETLVLKRIIHPIPIYARHVQVELPDLDKPLGFDLMAGDWVSPYGKGRRSDLVFEAHRRWASRKDFDVTLRISFSSSGDGIIPISVPLSTTAPSDGYSPNLSRSLSNNPAEGWKKSSVKNQDYFFRVRSVMGDRGLLETALYGKLRGDFTLDPINSKTTWIVFTYYLNPEPNSRNVEFDPKRNLFKTLSDREQVNRP